MKKIKSSKIRNKYLYIKSVGCAHELFEVSLKHTSGTIYPSVLCPKDKKNSKIL